MLDYDSLTQVENPRQDGLIEAAEDRMTDEEFERDMDIYRTKMRAVVEDCLQSCKADILVGPGDSTFTTVGMGAGYPIASVPLGFFDLNGRPFSLLFLAKKDKEDKLLQAMYAWERTFPENRKPPPQMQEWDMKSSQSV